MQCPIEGCAAELVERVDFGEMMTLVGFISPLGHNHDDNCRTRSYRCADGHAAVISRRNRRDFPRCTWAGKDECFCHPGKKVDEWPEEEARRIAAEGLTAEAVTQLMVSGGKDKEE